MNYYCISYRYSEEKNGVYEYLPVTSQITTDLNTAEKWFEEAVRVRTKSWRPDALIYVKERKLDYMCYLKEALFECKEAAYRKGFYLIELNCFSHNPCE